MFRFPLLFLALLAGPLCAAAPQLDALITAATSIRPTSSGPFMAYAVWSAPAPVLPPDLQLSVWMQPNGAGNFVKQGVAMRIKDEPSVQLLLTRADALGIPRAPLSADIDQLLATWQPRATDIRPDKSLAPELAALPLAARISRALQRGSEFAPAFTALQQLAVAHPALRMCLGTAWAGTIPSGAASNFELRRVDPASGSDGPVVARFSLVPGSGVSLTTPSVPLQVPDLTPGGDLTIKLRWGISDPLRRQLQHTTGFLLHRIARTTADSAGFPANPSLAQLRAFAAANPAAYGLASSAPIPADKLFTDAEAADFTADPMTYFFADRSPSFTDGSQFYYHLTARDLLGRESAPSGRGLGTACRTIPPDVPSDLTATDEIVTTGPFTGQRRIVLRWKANSNAEPAAGGRTTQRYAIYRGNPTDSITNPLALEQLEDPAKLALLTPILVNHAPDTLGRMVVVDPSFPYMESDPTSGKTRWYAVRAVHSSLCGPIMSAPSPPAFAFYRDRKGPGKPTGIVQEDCGIFSLRHLATTEFARTPLPGQAATDGSLYHIRLRCIRRSPAVEAVSFTITPPNGSATLLGPFKFGPGTNEVSFTLDSLTASATIRCIATDAALCYSPVSQLDVTRIAQGATVGTDFLFEAGHWSARELNPDDPLDAKLLTPVTLSSVVNLGSNAAKGTVAPLLGGRSHLIQRRIGIAGNNWSTVAVATPDFTSSTIHFPITSWSILGQSWRAFALPSRGDTCPCTHVPRPDGETFTAPVGVIGFFPAGTKEWRIYRKVDDGGMELVSSGTNAVPSPDTLPVGYNDTALPPNGATICYYLQSFDENGNPSPIVLIRCITILPDPGTPLLAQPTATDDSQMSLQWFCPRPGVRNFRVWLATTSTGLTAPDTPDAVKVLPPTPSVVSFRRPGAANDESAWILAAYELPELTSEGTSTLFNLKFPVSQGQEFIVWVEAIGLKASTKTESSKRIFTWSLPSDSTVAWPARPLPPPALSTGKAVYFPDVLAGTDDNRSTMNAREADAFPTGVRLGTILFRSVAIAGSTFTYDPAGFGSSPEAFLNPILKASGFISPLPCVLYRQTILPGGKPGSLIQTTPLREGIVWSSTTRDWDSEPSSPPTNASVIADPYIRILTREAGLNDIGELYLVDSQPVEYGATYHYYLVRYRSSSEEAPGEIDSVLDCGEIKIPEEP